MKRSISTFVAGCLTALVLAAPAQAEFGFHSFDVAFTSEDGTPATQAGAHPYAMTTSFGANIDEALIPEGWLKNVFFEQVPGLLGDTTAYPRCTTAEFLAVVTPGDIPACPLETQVGISAVSLFTAGAWETFPVFNLATPPGVLLRLAFRIATQNTFVDIGLNPNLPYNPVARSLNVPQILNVYGNRFQLWGDPSSPAHDELRGVCGKQGTFLEPNDILGFEFKETGEFCPVEPNPKPFLTVPGSCEEALTTSYEAVSWNDLDEDGKADTDSGGVFTHDLAGNPQPFTGCGKLGFKPSIEAQPTTKAAQSPTGLDFSLDVADEGLNSVDGLAQSQIRKAVVTLPEGMTANPSLAEGLEICSEADLEQETLSAAPGEGCPEASKIGTVEVESPLVEPIIKGSLFMAEPYENPFDSLLALYIVLKNKPLGIRVVQAAKIVPDPKTGQLVTIADEIPQLPFSHFSLHFREGGRSPLISPPRCGDYQAKAVLTPWSGGPDLTTTSAFEVISGPGEGPCPQAGIQPFNPGFAAGSLNNAAGAFSPFYLRLTRGDGEQDMTKFSSVLPPGVVGKLAGVSKCSDAQIQSARQKTGKAELASPSCPSNSQIGRAVGGAGVGSQLTYVGGKVYLSGPYNGAPLSVVAIVPAVAGPFDVGVVVTRQALRIDPLTAEVEADGEASDPIPHILAGIPLNVRDIRVYVDRENFTLNPTSCEESSARADLFGSFMDVFDPADDLPVDLSARYQAADCAKLGFKPRLALQLRGGTKRGGHPALRGIFRPRAGDANLSHMVLRLPRSAFLDQAHIRTICTRVQFRADNCPEGAIYGKAKAFSPLLDEPLVGPVYLRSSDNNLPDFVAHLHGLVDVEAVARIDSAGGGIRATFPVVPDAPLTKVVVDMQGGKKGLIVNSRNLCAAKSRAKARMLGHNGKLRTTRPVVRALGCGKGRGRSAGQ